MMDFFLLSMQALTVMQSWLQRTERAQYDEEKIPTERTSGR